MIKTKKLYYENQYLKSFKSKVLSCKKVEGLFEVILEETIFFPEGGGQPGDKGRLFNGSTVVDVKDTKEINGEIIHFVDNPIEGEVNGEIDWDYRFLNMQLHSGEQVFTACVHNKFGYDNVGFHIGEKIVTVDFNGPITKAELNEIEKEANFYVYKNLPIDTFFPSADELENYDYRSKKELEGDVRLVKIGDIDLCACCGTHLSRTGEIGIIKAIDMCSNKGGVRITLHLGQRAFEDYENKHDDIRKIGALLCVEPENTYSAVEKLYEKLKDENYKLVCLKRELLSLKLQSLEGEKVAYFDNDLSNDDFKNCINILKEKSKLVAVFSGNDEDGYRYAFWSREVDLKEYVSKFNEMFDGRGGGRGEMVMGSVKTTQKAISDYITKRKDV